MIRILEIVLLRHRRRVILDDIDHYEGVARIGEEKIAALRTDNLRRHAQAEAIGRRLALLERPEALIRASTAAREA